MPHNKVCLYGGFHKWINSIFASTWKYQFYSDINKICNLNEHCPTNNRHKSFLTTPIRAVNTTELFTQTEERVGRIWQWHRWSDQKINENSEVLSILTLSHTNFIKNFLIKNFSVSCIEAHSIKKKKKKRSQKNAYTCRTEKTDV